MPTFTITAPDGKRYKVTGATKEGALAALKSKLEGPQQPTQLQQQPQAQPQQTLQAPPPEQPPVGNPDASRLGYSLDQAQVMAGKGLEAFGRATGLEGVEQYGTGVVERNEQQIKDKNYQSTNQGSFLDQEGVGGKLAWTGEKIIENAATGAVGLGGAAATSLAAFFGAPLWVTLGLGGTAVAGSALLGTGEAAGEIEDKTGSYNPNLALAAGGVIGLLDRIGATAVIPKDQLLKMGTNQIIDTLVDKGYTGLAKELSTAVTKKAASEGITEAAQEGTSMSAAALSGGEYTPKEVANRLVDAAAIGTGQGGVTSTVIDSATMASSLFNNDGTLAEARNLTAQQKGAAGDVARELQQIATAEGFKLSNVDVTAQFGAKGALEAVREQNNGEITELVKALKGKLNSKNASSLDQVLSDFAPANAGIKSGKNKVSGYVSKTQMAALARLVGPYREGAALMNALAKSNVITGLFKDGMKGGISQFTDYFSPFGTSGAVYDPTRIGNIIVGGGAAAATMGQSVPIQAGIVGLGRLVDAATGRRNKLSRFVNKNINAQGLPSPSGVSLVDKAKALESDAKVRRKALARIATQIDAPPNANSPVGTILSGTGLSRDGLSQTINSMAQDFAGQPELAPVLESIQQNMDGDTNPVLELNEIIPIIGQYAQMTAPELIVATPDNPLLARGVQQSPAQTQAQTAAPGQPRSESSINADFDALAIEKKQLEAQASSIQDEISNLSLGEAQARKQEFAARMAPIQQRLADISSQMDSLGAENQARRSGNQFTTPENYQAGKSDNNSFARSLASQVSEDAGVSVSDKAQLLTALEDVQSSLGPDPVAALDEITTELQNIGVNRDVIDTYFKPYRDRVALQQARVGRMQAPETEDSPRFARIAPVPFNNDRMQQMFGVEDPTPGGNYIDLDTKEDLTGNTYAGGKVSIVDGKPVLDTSDDFSEPATKADGRKVKVNLFKQKAGWKWIDYDGPATIVSTEVGGKHHYALSSDFQNPVTLQTYPNQPSEPRLRPTTQGEVELGNKIGNISVRGKVHPVYDEVRIVSKSPERPRFQMAIPLFEEPLTIEGKPTVKKIGEAMNQDHLDKVGRQLLPEISPEDYSTVYGYADQELSKQLEQPNSGVGWYSKDVDDSMRLASKVFPTLADNPEHRQLYLTFAGIFSNGADPDNAFMMSAGAFDDFLRTGQIPVNRAQGFYDQGLEPPKTTFKSTKTGKMVTKDAGWGIRNQANEQQLGMLKYLVEREGGLKPAMEFLLTPQKRSDINEVMLDSGLYKAGRFTTKAEKAGADEYGFLAFGKKLGRYSLGLHGVDIDAGDTTIDLWYTRTFRRWTGRLLETPIGKEGVAAQPANDAERDAIFKLTGELAEKYNLPVGDVQALLWFFEKRTWGAQGLNTKEGTNSSGARKLLKERGIDPDQDDDRAGSDAAGVQPSQATEQPRFNQQPTGVAGILAQRIQGGPDGPTARGAVPGVQEVKGHVDHARALVEIGKPGSQYENGIKDQRMVEHLAEAVGITLKMFDDHNAMLDDGKISDDYREEGEASSGFYNRKENTARALLPGTEVIATSKIVNSFDSYITALHEVAHGIAGRDIEGNLTGTYDIGKNYLTGRKDAAPVETLEIMIGGLITTPNAKKRKIVQEIMSLQDDSTYDNGGSSFRPVRPTGPAKLRLAEMKPGPEKNKFRDRIKNFEKYSRSVPEFTVDPLIMYLQDPKKMKKVAPETAKAIRAFFVNSSKIRFYSHPLAMAFAVIMAMLMKQEQAEEEERQKQQQMAPGALTPPPGALSAA